MECLEFEKKDLNEKLNFYGSQKIHMDHKIKELIVQKENLVEKINFLESEHRNVVIKNSSLVLGFYSFIPGAISFLRVLEFFSLIFFSSYLGLLC